MAERLSTRDPEWAADLIRQYFLRGSIKDVYLNADYGKAEEYPSEASFYRLLREYNVVSSVGRPPSQMAEAIFFFNRMVQESQGLKAVYELMPHNFKTSLSTLRRIFGNIARGTFGRTAVALIITPEDDPNTFLVGQDRAIERFDLDKPYGSLTVPAVFTVRGEDPRVSILRALQQEVFTELAIRRELPLEIIPNNPELFAHIGVTDVDTHCFWVPVPRELLNEKYLKSPKIYNYQFPKVYQIAENNYRGYLRAGMKELAEAYRESQEMAYGHAPIFKQALLNRQVAVLYKNLALTHFKPTGMVPNYLWASRFGR